MDSPFPTQRIVPLRHTFHGHPAADLAALRGLARRLEPSGGWRSSRSTRSVEATRWSAEPRSEGTVDAALAALDEPGGWVTLHHIERDPTYRQWLTEIFDTVRARVVQTRRAPPDLHGHLFMSTAPSATPFQIDRENALWLQLRGHREVHVWDPRDPGVVDAELVERFIVSGDSTTVRLGATTLMRGWTTRLWAGDGIHWPATAPYRTVTPTTVGRLSDDVSVSLVLFFTAAESRRRTRILHVNRALRRIGVVPRPPGSSWLADTVKSAIGGPFVALRRPPRP